MGIINLIAVLVTIAAVLAAAGHAGYLALLTSTAKKRPGGAPAVEFARKRLPVAGGALGVTVLALLIASGGQGVADVLAILLGGGGGAFSLTSLRTTQTRFHNGQY